MATTLGYSTKKLADKADKRHVAPEAYASYLRERRKAHRKSPKKRA